jgi:hypothetical protein
MALKSWSFEWQGHLLEIDRFQSYGIAGLWNTDVVRLRIDGKKVDEQKKTMPWPLLPVPAYQCLLGKLKGTMGGSTLEMLVRGID